MGECEKQKQLCFRNAVFFWGANEGNWETTIASEVDCEYVGFSLVKVEGSHCLIWKPNSLVSLEKQNSPYTCVLNSNQIKALLLQSSHTVLKRKWPNLELQIKPEETHLNSSLRCNYRSYFHSAIVNYKRKKCTRNPTLSQIGKSRKLVFGIFWVSMWMLFPSFSSVLSAPFSLLAPLPPMCMCTHFVQPLCSLLNLQLPTLLSRLVIIHLGTDKNTRRNSSEGWCSGLRGRRGEEGGVGKSVVGLGVQGRTLHLLPLIGLALVYRFPLLLLPLTSLCWLSSLDRPYCLCLPCIFQNLQQTGKRSKQAITNLNNWKPSFINRVLQIPSVVPGAAASSTAPPGSCLGMRNPGTGGTHGIRTRGNPQEIHIHFEIWEVPLWSCKLKDLNYGFFLDNGKCYGDVKAALHT